MKKYSLILIFIIVGLLFVGCASNELVTEKPYSNAEETVDEEYLKLQDTIAELEQDNKELREELELRSKVEKEDIREELPDIEEENNDENLVSVENVRILEQSEKHKTLYPDMVEVIIKNNSVETIRNYKVGILGYDKNGYPVKIKGRFDFSGGSYELIGSGDDANILSGETGGKNYGWQLSDPHNIHYILANIIEVAFYDGKTWRNPNYNNWRNKYIEKPLPEIYKN